MYRCLSPGAIGIPATLDQGLLLAQAAGFEGLEINIGEVAGRARETSMGDVKQLFRDAGLTPGAWGLSVNYRAGEADFQKDLDRLPALAEAARELGCTRTATWIMPFSDELTYQENFAWHKDRMGRVARILGEYGCRLGLEFIGPATSRRGKKHEFIYNMAQMLELAAACGDNVGLLLDCWHWYTSGGTVDELKKLRPEDVVYVHVNDAPAGVRVDEQKDNVRCLPGETGVIDIRGFLRSLAEIGYDGPVTPEPFSQKLKEMNPDDAARVAGESMAKIWREAGLA
ncbi:MAG TPA: sugar phosphate isomerase/epimerase [Armatimonadota bacterium]|nr:sugar phosphate isomerase/epimerase [Armatimonadota bacterium]